MPVAGKRNQTGSLPIQLQTEAEREGNESWKLQEEQDTILWLDFFVFAR